MTARVAPFPWFGGKARLAPQIVPLLPPHTVYCEPFGGAASVLFAKPRAPLEVYNDVHRGLVAFFRVLRDRPEELARALRLTLYARVEYEESIETWDTGGVAELEVARRWFVCASQSFVAAPGRHPSWAYNRDARSADRPLGTGRVRARSFSSAVDELERFAERFRGVQVDNVDWRKAIDLYDGSQALLYVDPPYHPDTRARGGEYGDYELSADDHAELVDRLTAVTGSAIVSGYDHAAYERLDECGFSRIEIPHYKMASARRGAPRDRVTEVVWRRIAGGIAQQSLLVEATA